MTARPLVLAIALLGACASERTPTPPPLQHTPAAHTTQASRHTARRAKPPSPAPTATARQTLECPIDPDRADCRALCTAGATHEWCR